MGPAERPAQTVMGERAQDNAKIGDAVTINRPRPAARQLIHEKIAYHEEAAHCLRRLLKHLPAALDEDAAADRALHDLMGPR